MRWRNVALVSLLATAGFSANASAATPIAAQRVIAQIIAQAMVQAMAQAMVPPTGADDAAHPMPMNERMERRFPQPVRVGDLAGLPVLDDRASTIGFVRQVVRTPQGAIELIVSCGGWFGRGSRLVAVPIRSSASRAVNWCRSTCRAATTRPRRPGRTPTPPCSRTTPASASHWPAISRSRLCDADNFLVFADLYRVSRN